MKVIQQKNPNECGISCVNMLINHYHHCDNDFRTQLLEQCHLTYNGLSILELEQLCEKYQIQIESYEANIDDIKNLPAKQPIILILHNDSQTHYVIAQPVKNKLIIYDPIGKKYTLNYEQLSRCWAGFLCTTQKTKQKFKAITFKPRIDFKNQLLLNLFLLTFNLLIFAFEIILSISMSKLLIIDFSVFQIEEVMKLGIIFCLLGIINFGTNYISNYIKLRLILKHYIINLNNFMLNLMHKRQDFFGIYNQSKLLQTFQIIEHLTLTYLFYLSDIFTQLIINVAAITILIIISTNSWIIILIYLFLSLLFVIINYYIERKYQNFFIKNHENYHSQLIKYYDCRRQNHFYEIEKEYLTQFNQEVRQSYKYSLISNNNKNLSNFIFSWIDYFWRFLLIVFLLMGNRQQKISIIFFVINIFQIYSTKIKDLFNLFKMFLVNKPLVAQIQAFFAINNLGNKNQNQLVQTNNITFQNIEIKNSLCLSVPNLLTHYLINALVNHNDKLDLVKINHLHLNTINSLSLNKTIIFLDENFNLDNQTFEKLSQDSRYSCFLQRLDFSQLTHTPKLEFSNLPILTKQILILIYLCEQENKIICLNNFFTHTLDSTLVPIIFELLQKINTKNFIISNCQNKQILEFYEYHL